MPECASAAYPGQAMRPAERWAVDRMALSSLEPRERRGTGVTGRIVEIFFDPQ